jgi:RND family efflux transporter MFP subunit
MSDLFDRGVAARKEVEEATHEVADAQADLASARAAAGAAETVAARSVVHATFDGIVAKRSHNPGDLVEPTAADAVLRVVDPRRLEVAAQISLTDAPRVRLGAAARIAGAEITPTLAVASRPAAVQEGTATGADSPLVQEPGELSRSAPRCRSRSMPRRTTKIVLVPTSALVHEGEATAVFVLMGDTAERRPVRVGLTNEAHTELVSGVKAGETVITSNQNGLPDGAKVIVGAPPKDGP